jgi:hypothetical protein
MVKSVIYLLFSYQTGYIMWHSRLMIYIPFGCASGNIDRCLSFCTFSFGHRVVCSSSICGFWLPLWYLQTLLLTKVLNMELLEIVLYRYLHCKNPLSILADIVCLDIFLKFCRRIHFDSDIVIDNHHQKSHRRNLTNK